MELVCGCRGGLSSHKTMLDLKNGSAAYSGLASIQNAGDLNTKAGRKDIKAAIDAKYDGTYETESWKKWVFSDLEMKLIYT